MSALTPKKSLSSVPNAQGVSPEGTFSYGISRSCIRPRHPLPARGQAEEKVMQALAVSGRTQLPTIPLVE
jgi:hypothetical protein